MNKADLSREENFHGEGWSQDSVETGFPVGLNDTYALLPVEGITKVSNWIFTSKASRLSLIALRASDTLFLFLLPPPLFSFFSDPPFVRDLFNFFLSGEVCPTPDLIRKFRSGGHLSSIIDSTFSFFFLIQQRSLFRKFSFFLYFFLF